MSEAEAQGRTAEEITDAEVAAKIVEMSEFANRLKGKADALDEAAESAEEFAASLRERAVEAHSWWSARCSDVFYAKGEPVAVKRWMAGGRRGFFADWFEGQRSLKLRERAGGGDA